MSNKLFVGGLSWDTNDESLRDGFAQHGAVADAKVITDRETGRSRGFGFVTMSDSAGTEAAMRAMDGSTLDGRTIRVNEANDRERGGGGGFGGGGGGGRDRDRGGRDRY
jgi:RNA recognition motif-containing protein